MLKIIIAMVRSVCEPLRAIRGIEKNKQKWNNQAQMDDGDNRAHT